MKDKLLHIVSFDNPFPPVYGGIVEVFYKLKPLSQLGIAIHFHCFVDEIPTQNPELEAICAKVYYYKNNKSAFDFFSRLPFSVRNRKSGNLLKNLNLIDAPILFEGLKTTYLVSKDTLPDHHKILRLHNIEHNYFYGISKSETNPFKKLIFFAEGLKYKYYENVIGKFQKVITLSNFENSIVTEKFRNAMYIPVFHGNETVQKLDGVGKYAIYHGDLRMSDNMRVAKYLIRIFKEITNFDLVIASSNGEKEIRELIQGSANISFSGINNFAHLKQLLNDAQINLVFSFQQSGTKLKLMNSLCNSRFCFINENIMDDAKVTQLCEFTNSESELINKISTFRNKPFQDYEIRKSVLETYMNDSENAKILANAIFEKWN